MWRRTLNRFVLPQLPGAWRVSGALAYREPAEWLLCGLVMSNVATSSRFKVSAVVQLLAVPNRNITGPHLLQLGRGTGRAVWDSPATVEDAASAMTDLVALIQAEALP